MGKQRTFCYCPNCGLELCATSPCTDTDWVRYTCRCCGTESEWDFDAPVPILRKWHLGESYLKEAGDAAE